MKSEPIFTIEGSLESSAVAHVMSLFSDITETEPNKLTSREIENNDPLQEESDLNFRLIITEDQINFLPLLRLKDWSGGVLIISSKTRDELLTRYAILRQGKKAHDSSKLNLSDIHLKINNLKPLGEYNLEDIKDELNTNPTKTLENIRKELDSLKKNNRRNENTYSTLSNTVNSLLNTTPAACHHRIDDPNILANLIKEIPDFPDSPQISTCFNILIEKVKTNYSDRKIDLIGEVAQYWSKKCIGTNESLNINQP
jgi:hypothetical protein